MESLNRNTDENKMGVMPENKLLLSMSVPIMISMLVQAIYNIVDSIFVARINEEALTAVSLVFPMQSIMIALSVGTGVGVNAVLSRRLGQKKYEEANKIANVSLLLAFLNYLIFLFVGLLLSRWYFAIQTTNDEIINYGQIYLKIICVMSFGLFGQVCFERLLQSTGRTIQTMIMQGTGAILNIILDPILIFGYFGFPEMGIAGAALATVIGQIVGMILGLIFNILYNKEIKLRLKEIRFDWLVIKQIYIVGIPAILMQSIGSVMTFIMNKILLSFTPTAAAVFGIYFKLQSFIFMPVFGLSNGMVPIIAYNYGAEKRERILKTIKYSMIYAITIMFIGFIIAELIPHILLQMFDASETMLTIGVPAIRIICIIFVFAGFNIIASSLFQALGNSMYSLLLSCIRQLIVLLPLAYLLSLTKNLNAVWMAFPISEIVATIVTIILLRKTYNKIKQIKVS